MAAVFSGTLEAGADSGWVPVVPARTMLVQLSQTNATVTFSVDGVSEVVTPVSVITPWGQPYTYKAVDLPFAFIKVRNTSASAQAITATFASV